MTVNNFVLFFGQVACSNGNTVFDWKRTATIFLLFREKFFYRFHYFTRKERLRNIL